MENLKMHTPDLAEENYRKLVELFPNAVTETIDENGEVVRAIDADVLRQEISATVVEGPQERYQFTWPDKKKSMVLANQPIAKTLRLDRGKSVGRDGTLGSIDTENIYIEGDNLDVLKLLQETYLGKVKMIYIDPPYNTGSDAFVYDDDSSISSDEFSERSGQRDEDGNILFDMRQNNESNGRFHTDWLNMLYPRLRLAKDLLSDEGCIFISIDDNEVENLRKICDEIFGTENFIGTIVVKSNPRGSMSISELAMLHEYVLLYSKNRNNINIVGHELSDEMNSEYKYTDSENQRYRLLGLRMRGGFWRRNERPNLYFPIYVDPVTCKVSVEGNNTYSVQVFPIQPSTNEDGTWRWGKEKVRDEASKLIAKQVTRDGEKIWDIFQKDYYDRKEGRRTKVKSIWEDAEVNYQNGTTEIKNLLGKAAIFNYSKPVFLIEQMLKMIGYNKQDIIFDFFSGSATTAQSVMQLNAEDGGHRKFIIVQIPESCAEKSEAAREGYANICDIGEERIRRAGKKIREELPVTSEELDIGFRVFRVDSSNMERVDYSPVETNQTQIGLFADNIKPDRTPEDLLFQTMLDLGVLLSSKIEETVIAGKRVFAVADGYLLACFDQDITDDVVTEIAKQQPFYAVFRDSGIASDDVMTNFEQIFETYSPKTQRKVL